VKIYPKLVLSVQKRGQAMKWRSGNRYEFAKGMTAEDLVQDAIKKLYTEERTWNLEKDDDLEKFLTESVLKSLLSNLVRSKDNTLVQIIHQETDRTLDESVKVAKPHEDHATHLMSRINNPEEIAISYEDKNEEIKRNEEARKILNRLMALASKDKEVTLILECTMEGITKPQMMVEKTGLSIEQIYNGQKRFRRLMKKVRDESKGGVGYER